MDIKSLLPDTIVSKAFEFNSELSWKIKDIPELSAALKEKQIAILGGEVWEKKDNAPSIGSGIYHWNSEGKNNNESWSDYVNRTINEMSQFTEKLPLEITSNDGVYINITMTDK